MKNQTLINAAKHILLNLVLKCTSGQQDMFKRFYSKKADKLNDSIENVVENMDVDKIDWAISQTERTIEKNGIK